MAQRMRPGLLPIRVLLAACLCLTASAFAQDVFPSKTVHIVVPVQGVHEETGRKTLYVGDQLTRRIVGMTERESAPLLKFLSGHIVDPLFTYRQKWQKNDIIMWDNRSTMHLALADFPPGSHRYCVRTTILGSPSGHYYQA